MTITVREFTRKFPKYQRAALSGSRVEVRDRRGNGFVFLAASVKAVSLADAMGDLVGSVQTGKARKTLAGYGRD